MPEGPLEGKPVEAMITLVERIAAQELPGPIGVSNGAKIIVVAELGRPGWPHIESSTRHTTPRTSCSMGLRALRRTSLMCSALYNCGENACLLASAATPPIGRVRSRDGPTRACSW